APFGIDGAPVDRGFWEYAKLSPDWLAVCQKHIRECGSVSEMPLQGSLSHLRIKFTSASSAALVTIFVHGKTVSSLLLLTGQSPSVDTQVAKMYVSSLQ